MTTNTPSPNTAPKMAGVPAKGINGISGAVGKAISLADLTVSDADSPSLILTLSAQGGTLSGLIDADKTKAGYQLKGTAAEINAALDAAAFTPNGLKAAQIALSVTDGKLTTKDTFVVNTPPTLAGVPTAAQTVRVGAAAALADFTVADINSSSLEVTLTASNGTLGGLSDADATQAGIQLKGSAKSLNAALAKATFTASASGAASVNLSVSDGQATPVTATYQLKANAAPSFAELPAKAINQVKGVVGDLVDFKVADSEGDALVLTLTAKNGSLGGLVDADKKADGLQLKGTAAEINTALAGATFKGAAAGAAAIGLSLTDGLATAVTGKYQLNILDAKAPVISHIPLTPAKLVVGDALSLADITLADADSKSLTLTLSAQGGDLAGLTDADAKKAGVQLKGTVAELNAALHTATFKASGAGEAKIGFSVTDGKFTTTDTYNFHAVDNLPPTLAGIPSSAQTVTTGAAVALDDFSVADSDSGSLEVTLTPSNGTLNNLTDADTNKAGIQLKGSAASINIALAGATFTASNSGAASIGISVSDGKAAPVTATYQLQANEAPSIAGIPAAAQAVTVGSAAALADFSVADKEGGTLEVTLIASNGTLGGLSDTDATKAGIQLQGSAASINSVLAGATFTAAATGAASVNVSVSDGKAAPITAVYSLQASQTLSGKVIDGYISGATVFVDANNDGILNAGEASATTQSDGSYSFSAGATGKIVASGGTDTSTGKAFQGVMSAPVGATVINPLTTLISGMVDKGKSEAEAQQIVVKALGLENASGAALDLKTYDPIAHVLDSGNSSAQSAQALNIAAAAAKIANLVIATGNTLVGVAGGETKLDKAAASEAVFSALVDQIAKSAEANPSNQTKLDLTSTTVVKDLVIQSAAKANDADLSATKVEQIAANAATVLADNVQKVEEIAAKTGDATKLLAQVVQVQVTVQDKVASQLQQDAQKGDLSTSLSNYTGSKLDTAVQAAHIADIDPNSTTDNTVVSDTNSGQNTEGGTVTPTPTPTPDPTPTPTPTVTQHTYSANQGSVMDANPKAISVSGGDDTVVVSLSQNSIESGGYVSITGFASGDSLRFTTSGSVDTVAELDALGLYGVSDQGSASGIIEIIGNQGGTVQDIILTGITASRASVGGSVDNLAELATLLGSNSVKVGASASLASIATASYSAHQGSVLDAAPREIDLADVNGTVNVGLDQNTIQSAAYIKLTHFGSGDHLAFDVSGDVDTLAELDALRIYGISDNGTDIHIVGNHNGTVQDITLTGITTARSGVGGSVDSLVELNTLLGGSALTLV